MIQRMTEKIRAAVPGAQVHVADPQADGQHFEAVVISERFAGMPLVKQHQLVMNALKEEFAGQVHALHLRTYTPERWAELERETGKEIW